MAKSQLGKKGASATSKVLPNATATKAEKPVAASALKPRPAEKSRLLRPRRANKDDEKALRIADEIMVEYAETFRALAK